MDLQFAQPGPVEKRPCSRDLTVSRSRAADDPVGLDEDVSHLPDSRTTTRPCGSDLTHGECRHDVLGEDGIDTPPVPMNQSISQLHQPGLYRLLERDRVAVQPRRERLELRNVGGTDGSHLLDALLRLAPEGVAKDRHSLGGDQHASGDAHPKHVAPQRFGRIAAAILPELRLYNEVGSARRDDDHIGLETHGQQTIPPERECSCAAPINAFQCSVPIMGRWVIDEGAAVLPAGPHFFSSARRPLPWRRFW
jgi:hypothetical protein